MFWRRKKNADGTTPAPKRPKKAPVPVINDATANMTPEEKEAAAKAAKAARMYFNSNTQAAIVAYQKATEKKERDMWFVKEINPAFCKLVENLINIHKFTGLHDTQEELKNDCVHFLFETLGKFDATRGTNAFSYFNVVAKNWLIIRTKQKAQKVKRNVSLDDIESMSANEQRILEDKNTVLPQDEVMLNEHNVKNTIDILYEIRTKAKSENELSCINSIITIFENVDGIDLLNKNAILLYMRELSGLSPKQLTTSLQQIKKHYKKMKVDPKFKLW